MMDVVVTCPLGSKCEEAKDGELYRCAWFTKISGKDPQTGAVIDERRCAMNWLPLLTIDNTKASIGTGAAIESFRNETVKLSASSNTVMLNSLLNKKVIERQ